MFHHVARPLALVALLIFMAGVQASAPVADPPTPQACDGTATVYQAPGGSETGTGTSAQRARRNAGQNAAHAVDLSVTPCAVCEDGRECTGDTYYDWDNYQVGTPVWDPLLNVFTVSCKWDGCKVKQYCTVCD